MLNPILLLTRRDRYAITNFINFTTVLQKAITSRNCSCICLKDQALIATDSLTVIDGILMQSLTNPHMLAITQHNRLDCLSTLTQPRFQHWASLLPCSTCPTSWLWTLRVMFFTGTSFVLLYEFVNSQFLMLMAATLLTVNISALTLVVSN